MKNLGPKDGHWTPTGHAVVAEEVATALGSSGVGTLRSTTVGEHHGSPAAQALCQLSINWIGAAARRTAGRPVLVARVTTGG